ncbi:MAG: sel1 repeat family protein, partial [Deltaproteobacteria bacterium]
EQGDAKAQHGLGVMYHNGFGVERDDREANKWFRKAAEGGYFKNQ